MYIQRTELTGDKLMDSIKREIRPNLLQRVSGGWLAISPANSGISIGVDAPTEEEALERFRSVFSRWLEILDTKTLDVPNSS